MTRRRSLRSLVWILVATAIVGGCGYVPGLGPAVEIPGGVGHRMSVGDVEQTIRANVASDVVATGRQIRPFRVVSIRLVAPFERVHPTPPDGGSTMSFSTNTTTWVVRAEGTFRDCASTCATYSSALLVVEDARGVIVGREPAGPASLDPVSLRD